MKHRFSLDPDPRRPVDPPQQTGASMGVNGDVAQAADTRRSRTAARGYREDGSAAEALRAPMLAGVPASAGRRAGIRPRAEGWVRRSTP